MKSSRSFSWRKTLSCNLFWMFTFSLPYSNEFFFLSHFFRLWLPFFWVVPLLRCFFLSSIHSRSIHFSSFFFHCEFSVLAILITLASLNFYREDRKKNIVKYNDLNGKSNKMTQNSIDLKHLQTTKEKKWRFLCIHVFFMA